MTNGKAPTLNSWLAIGLVFGGIWLLFSIPSYIEDRVRDSIQACVRDKHSELSNKAIIEGLFPFKIQNVENLVVTRVTDVPMPELTKEQSWVFAEYYRKAAAYEECTKTQADRRYELEELKRLRKERKK